MSIDDNKIIDNIRKNIYTCEKDGYGHIYIVLSKFTPSKYTKKQKIIIVNYIVQITRESLVISNNNNNNTSYVHFKLTNCKRENLNFNLFKKINTIFSETFDDTLETMFVYYDSKLFSTFWKIIKNFIDKDTVDKIMLVAC